MIPRLAFIVHGYPGAGKTTLAKSIASENSNIVLLSNDAIRVENEFPVMGKIYTRKVYEIAAAQSAHALSSGRSVLYDATFYCHSYRQIVFEVLLKLAPIIVLVSIVIPKSLCRRRISHRPTRVDGVNDLESFDALIDRWEPWSDVELSYCHTIVEFDGSSKPQEVTAISTDEHKHAIRIIRNACKGQNKG